MPSSPPVQATAPWIACSRAYSRVTGRSIEVTLLEADAARPGNGPEGSKEPSTPEPPAAETKEDAPRKKDEFTREVADLFGGVIEDL